MDSQSILLCKEIKCPYWSDRTGNYGCQRWQTSEACQLKFAHPYLQSNEYALYLDSDRQDAIAGLKNENNRFFREDPKYQKDREFAEAFPDLTKGSSFVVGSIQD